MTIFPGIKLVLIVAAIYLLNMAAAFVTLKSWLIGSQNQLLSGDLVDLIASLFIFLFIGSGGVYVGILLYLKMVEHPSGRPNRGCSMVKFSVWICGISGCINIIGVVISWFDLTGAAP